MKKILEKFERKDYFNKNLDFEKTFIRKGLSENKRLKNDAIWRGEEEKIFFLENERKKILQKQNFFKNINKEINFLINNVQEKHLSQKMQAIKAYNIRKRKAKAKAVALLSCKL